MKKTSVKPPAAKKSAGAKSVAKVADLPVATTPKARQIRVRVPYARESKLIEVPVERELVPGEVHSEFNPPGATVIPGSRDSTPPTRDIVAELATLLESRKADLDQQAEDIASREKALDERSARFESLKAEYVARAESLLAEGRVLDERRKELDARLDAVSERERSAARVETGLNAYTKTLDEQDETLLDEARRLDAIRKELDERRKALDAEEKLVAEKGEELRTQTQVNDERDIALNNKESALDDREIALDDREETLKENLPIEEARTYFIARLSMLPVAGATDELAMLLDAANDVHRDATAKLIDILRKEGF